MTAEPRKGPSLCNLMLVVELTNFKEGIHSMQISWLNLIKNILILSLLNLLVLTAHADSLEYVEWSTGECSYKGQLNTAVVTPQFIQSAGLGFSSFIAKRHFKYPNNLMLADKEAIINEINNYTFESMRLLDDLKNIAVPDLPDVKNYHASELNNIALEVHIYLAKLKFLATEDKQYLATSFNGVSISEECLDWTDIDSQKDIFENLPIYLDKICERNSQPIACKNRIFERISGNKIAAQIEMLTYGWGKCINREFRQDRNGVLRNSALETLKLHTTNVTQECFM